MRYVTEHSYMTEQKENGVSSGFLFWFPSVALDKSQLLCTLVFSRLKCRALVKNTTYIHNIFPNNRL